MDPDFEQVGKPRGILDWGCLEILERLTVETLERLRELTVATARLQ